MPKPVSRQLLKRFMSSPPREKVISSDAATMQTGTIEDNPVALSKTSRVSLRLTR
jgi:hypothetical protein